MTEPSQAASRREQIVEHAKNRYRHRTCPDCGSVGFGGHADQPCPNCNAVMTDPRVRRLAEAVRRAHRGCRLSNSHRLLGRAGRRWRGGAVLLRL